MTRQPESGFNVEKAITEHIPAELKAAEADVKQLESKLDAARERVYRLRSIAQAIGMKPEIAPESDEPRQAVGATA